MQLRKVADKSGPEPEDGQPWPLKHVEVIASYPTQAFSPKFVYGAIKEGWLRMDGDVLSFDTKPKVRYQVIRNPGRYCCYCNKPLGSFGEAEIHLLLEHKDEVGRKQPDPQNPAGHRVDNFYACERID